MTPSELPTVGGGPGRTLGGRIGRCIESVRIVCQPLVCAIQILESVLKGFVLFSPAFMSRLTLGILSHIGCISVKTQFYVYLESGPSSYFKKFME